MNTIIDSTGRRGTITEIRDHGVFAKPEGRSDSEPAGSASITQSTFWSLQPDGSLRGLWIDSPHNGFVTANDQANTLRQ